MKLFPTHRYHRVPSGDIDIDIEMGRRGSTSSNASELLDLSDTAALIPGTSASNAKGWGVTDYVVTGAMVFVGGALFVSGMAQLLQSSETITTNGNDSLDDETLNGFVCNAVKNIVHHGGCVLQSLANGSSNLVAGLNGIASEVCTQIQQCLNNQVLYGDYSNNNASQHNGSELVTHVIKNLCNDATMTIFNRITGENHTFSENAPLWFQTPQPLNISDWYIGNVSHCGDIIGHEEPIPMHNSDGTIDFRDMN